MSNLRFEGDVWVTYQKAYWKRMIVSGLIKPAIVDPMEQQAEQQ